MGVTCIGHADIGALCVGVCVIVMCHEIMWQAYILYATKVGSGWSKWWISCFRMSVCYWHRCEWRSWKHVRMALALASRRAGMVKELVCISRGVSSGTEKCVSEGAALIYKLVKLLNYWLDACYMRRYVSVLCLWVLFGNVLNTMGADFASIFYIIRDFE